MAQQPDPLQPVHMLNTQVSAEVSAILTRTLALSPDTRYASATALRDSLRASPAGCRLWGDPKPARFAPPDLPVGIVITAGLLLCIGIGALLLLLFLFAQ